MNQLSSALLLSLLLVGCGNKAAPTETSESPATPASGHDPAEEAPEAQAAQTGSDAAAKEQSFAEGVAHMCNAPSDMRPALADLDATQKAFELAEWIDKGLTNAEAKALFASLAEKTPAQKREAVSAAAERAGIGSCELSGIWEEPAKP